MAKPIAPVLIRPLTPGDLTDWKPLWAAYLEFYNTTLPADVVETSFSRLTDPSVTDYHGLVAETGGRLVGLTHFIYHRHGWKTEPVCYLQDLFTAPDMRGTGVGAALIRGVFDTADAAGAPGVYWLTQHDNAPARRLYDRIAQVTPFIKYQRVAA